MANFIVNTILVYGPAEDAKKMKTLVSTERSEFDFEAILPMPAEIKDTESSSVSTTAWDLKYGEWNNIPHPFAPRKLATREAALAAARASDWFNLCEHINGYGFQVCRRSIDELADALESNRLNHGARTWVEWSMRNWGVRRTAEGAAWKDVLGVGKGDPDVMAAVGFSTPWDPPTALICTLSRRFPSLTLRASWIDIDDHMRGFQLIRNGKVVASKQGRADPPHIDSAD